MPYIHSLNWEPYLAALTKPGREITATEADRD